MFDTRVSLYFLLSANYAEAFNVAYSHGLNDAQLWSGLKKLCADGLVKEVAGDPYSHFELTAKGGGIWEEEREPKWNKYCDIGEYLDEHGNTRLELFVASVHTGAEVLSLAAATKVYAPIDAERASWEEAPSPIYWKSSLPFWKAEISNITKGNAARFYERRTWWSSVGDLNIRS